MNIKIALAGNPNCGKTTLFNALTGSNQFVGNWPGVTVEKKEGKLKKHSNVTVTDLPGIYSLSPYTLEEVIARDYLVEEHPDVILNLVDGTNLERNLYLTTQLAELNIPMVVAVNMMDVVQKNGDTIRTAELKKVLGCPVVELSALKETGVMEAAEAAIQAAETGKTAPEHSFSRPVEDAISQIGASGSVPSGRWYAVKVFERDEKVLEKLNIPADKIEQIESVIQAAEKELDDDAESIIAGERYDYIASVIKTCCKMKNRGKLTRSDKIDKVVTNRFLGLPIFAVIMFFVYWIAMVAVGTPATDFVNDKIFDEGFHLFGNREYEEAAEEFEAAKLIVDGYDAYVEENGKAPEGAFSYAVTDEETLEITYETAELSDYQEAAQIVARYGEEGPDPADYARYVPSIPALIESGLDSLNTASWLKGLVLDGIVAGVGAVLGFVPQMLVLFLMLAFLEACGYMARIAFILDRIFRKFGLSGKSFIPMLVGTGCGVPGIMASRTIENQRDRRMTIITTTFIPCGAKVPFIAMIAGAIFGGSPYVATSAYFIGMAAIIVSGIMLKKTKPFAGDPAAFVMELPAYHWPAAKNVLRSMWERGWSFIKKAGTIILLSTVIVWFTSFFGVVDGKLTMLSEEELDHSLLAAIGSCIAWIFTPLGWGNWEAAVASITGLVAKENIVGTMGILYGTGGGTVYQTLAATFTPVTGYSFLVFNLLCAPCFAAIGAIKREMANAKWTLFAVGYQCAFAYAISLMINQFGNLFTGNVCGVGSVIFLLAAVAVLVTMLYMLLRKDKTRKGECLC